MSRFSPRARRHGDSYCARPQAAFNRTSSLAKRLIIPVGDGQWWWWWGVVDRARVRGGRPLADTCARVWGREALVGQVKTHSGARSSPNALGNLGRRAPARSRWEFRFFSENRFFWLSSPKRVGDSFMLLRYFFCCCCCLYYFMTKWCANNQWLRLITSALLSVCYLHATWNTAQSNK